MREFERASTTAANAYVQSLMSRYLTRFSEGLRVRGITGPLFVTLSEGVIAAVEIVKRMPIRVCESGPAAGAVTAAVAAQLHEPHILSFDMGGTTAKTCVVHEGKPVVTTDFEVARRTGSERSPAGEDGAASFEGRLEALAIGRGLGRLVQQIGQVNFSGGSYSARCEKLFRCALFCDAF